MAQAVQLLEEAQLRQLLTLHKMQKSAAAAAPTAILDAGGGLHVQVALGVLGAVHPNWQTQVPLERINVGLQTRQVEGLLPHCWQKVTRQLALTHCPLLREYPLMQDRQVPRVAEQV